MAHLSELDTATDAHRPNSPVAPRWPLERVLFALAGTMTLLSVLLAATVSPWFLLLTTFVGINQWIFVAVGNCPASLIARRFGITPRCSS